MLGQCLDLLGVVIVAAHKLGALLSHWDTKSKLTWQPEYLNTGSLEFLQLLLLGTVLPGGGDAKSAGGLWPGGEGEGTCRFQEWIVMGSAFVQGRRTSLWC